MVVQTSRYLETVPRDDDNLKNPPPMNKDSSLGREDMLAPTNGYWCLSGRRLLTCYFTFSWQQKWPFLRFFLKKSTVQYSDELNNFLATKISEKYFLGRPPFYPSRSRDSSSRGTGPYR